MVLAVHLRYVDCLFCMFIEICCIYFRYVVGMGEVQVVINGVEFRTRHNDFELVKPSNNSEYEDVEYIDFPEVSIRSR